MQVPDHLAVACVRDIITQDDYRRFYTEAWRSLATHHVKPFELDQRTLSSFQGLGLPKTSATFALISITNAWTPAGRASGLLARAAIQGETEQRSTSEQLLLALEILPHAWLLHTIAAMSYAELSDKEIRAAFLRAIDQENPLIPQWVRELGDQDHTAQWDHHDGRYLAHTLQTALAARVISRIIGGSLITTFDNLVDVWDDLKYYQPVRFEDDPRLPVRHQLAVALKWTCHEFLDDATYGLFQALDAIDNHLTQRQEGWKGLGTRYTSCMEQLSHLYTSLYTLSLLEPAVLQSTNAGGCSTHPQAVIDYVKFRIAKGPKKGEGNLGPQIPGIIASFAEMSTPAPIVAHEELLTILKAEPGVAIPKCDASDTFPACLWWTREFRPPTAFPGRNLHGETESTSPSRSQPVVDSQLGQAPQNQRNETIAVRGSGIQRSPRHPIPVRSRGISPPLTVRQTDPSQSAGTPLPAGPLPANAVRAAINTYPAMSSFTPINAPQPVTRFPELDPSLPVRWYHQPGVGFQAYNPDRSPEIGTPAKSIDTGAVQPPRTGTRFAPNYAPRPQLGPLLPRGGFTPIEITSTGAQVPSANVSPVANHSSRPTAGAPRISVSTNEGRIGQSATGTARPVNLDRYDRSSYVEAMNIDSDPKIVETERSTTAQTGIGSPAAQRPKFLPRNSSPDVVHSIPNFTPINAPKLVPRPPNNVDSNGPYHIIGFTPINAPKHAPRPLAHNSPRETSRDAVVNCFEDEPMIDGSTEEVKKATETRPTYVKMQSPVFRQSKTLQNNTSPEVIDLTSDDTPFNQPQIIVSPPATNTTQPVSPSPVIGSFDVDTTALKSLQAKNKSSVATSARAREKQPVIKRSAPLRDGADSLHSDRIEIPDESDSVASTISMSESSQRLSMTPGPGGAQSRSTSGSKRFTLVKAPSGETTLRPAGHPATQKTSPANRPAPDASSSTTSKARSTPSSRQISHPKSTANPPPSPTPALQPQSPQAHQLPQCAQPNSPNTPSNTILLAPRPVPPPPGNGWIPIRPRYHPQYYYREYANRDIAVRYHTRNPDAVSEGLFTAEEYGCWARGHRKENGGVSGYKVSNLYMPDSMGRRG